MKTLTRKLALAVAALLLMLSLPFFMPGQAFAQEGDEPPPQDAPPGERPPNRNDGELIRRLNLTPEQIKSIREIREQNAEEFRQNRQRLMRAQRGLDEAIYADNVEEADIEARAREVATAQTAVARHRALTELRIRRVLTSEQLNLLRRFRQEARERDREDRQQERRGNGSAFQERKRPKAGGASDVNLKPGLAPPKRSPAGRGRP